ncbi:CD209 antigen-like protein C isoform X2 [Acanthopagrus latus]|uniref:CD209 antigen-like protein C isoform X2 n=1 Tax=Acanthopagrus latus TaxID=8177 RepID=UPI00187CD93D|nr:CD209 antigen-like protein C isoform X2 [Acanthopagrus latus]
MSERAREMVKGKGQKASKKRCVEMRNPEDDAERETAADAGSCRTCRLTACVAVVVATTVLVIGLSLCLLLYAPEADHTSKTPEMQLTERLQRCQKEHRDLSLMLQTVTQDSRCRVCPDGWLWWRSRCYFFSVGLQENRQWNESAEFCRKHNSSLVVIKDSGEMEFIQGVMRTFPRVPFLWVGLTDAEQEGQWLWWDGTDIQHYMPLTVEWDADHRDCADLRGGGSLFAASCEAYGPWACQRDS